MASKYLEELERDLQDIYLPEDLDSYDKLNCSLNIGARIYWYYTEDNEFFDGEGESPRDYPNDIFSGIVIPRHGIEIPGPFSEIDPEDCVVVIVSSPEEKSYPESSWTSLKRVLNDENLVEIFRID